ncbi:ferritin [bacterium]|nr:ferritin [bacterium]MBU1921309.1 ferritin [bacterium]
MISKKMQTALNKQIKLEMDSAYIYMAMSNWCTEQNLSGFASWMMNQYNEEMAHAKRIYDFLHDVGAAVVLEQIDKPASKWKGPQDVFEVTLAHEQKVTASIHKLYELAKTEKDYPSEVMLQWFVNEQVEEEATATEILERIKMVGEKSNGIWWIDKELGKRGAAK